ncbi:MAG: MgtC/SapB family protein [Candidatus Woesearchaeota archaeon]
MQVFAEQVIRLLLAAALSSLIGLEREKSHKPAGLRTHVLVCLGATLATLVGVYYFTADGGKIVQGIITGIGFLGAGAIIWSKNSVHGLTTAASIWLVAVLGVAVGVGFYWLSVFFVLLVLLLLRVKRIERKL